jgi:hypothetical protein
MALAARSRRNDRRNLPPWPMRFSPGPRSIPRYAAPSIRSSGLIAFSSDRSENAASSRRRSQITRPSTRLGRGMRPSETISSNLVEPTPI